MKRWLFLFLGIFSLTGCLATTDTDELSTLKIKVLNLEAMVKEQEKSLTALDKRVTETEKRVTEEISGKFLEAQAKLLSEVNDLRKELSIIQSKLEEIQFQREAKEDLQRKTLEETNTRIASLELKIKELEEKLKGSYSNQKAMPQPFTSNQTISNQTSPEKISESKEKPKEKTSEKPKEEDLYQRAFQLFEKGDLKGAKAAFEEYLKAYPKGKWVPQTHFYLGEILFKERDYETAILEYQKLIDTPGPNPLKPRALLRQAEAFFALKDKKAAEILLRKIIKNYPTTQEAKEAEKRLKTLK